MEELKQDYSKYKPYIISTVMVFVGVFFLFQIILPQLNSISELNQKIEAKKDDVKRYSDTLEAIETTPDATLNDDLNLAEKSILHIGNIKAIYLGLLTAAFEAKVNLAGFSLNSINTYTKEKDNPKSITTSDLGSIQVKVKLESDDNRNYMKYIDEAYDVLPILQVKSFETKEGAGNFLIEFYYKPYDLKELSKIRNIREINIRDQKLLMKLKKLDEKKVPDSYLNNISSPSASMAGEAAN